MKNTTKKDKIGHAEQKEKHHEPKCHQATESDVEHTEPNEGEVSDHDEKAVPGTQPPTSGSDNAQNTADQTIPKEAEISNDDEQATPGNPADQLNFATVELASLKSEILADTTELFGRLTKLEALADNMEMSSPDRVWHVRAPETRAALRVAIDIAPEAVISAREVLYMALECEAKLGEAVADTLDIAGETELAIWGAMDVAADTLDAAARLLLAFAAYVRSW